MTTVTTGVVRGSHVGVPVGSRSWPRPAALPLPRRTAVRRAALTLSLLAALAGCASTRYLPTEPRPALGPGVAIEIVSVRSGGQEAEVSIRTARSTLIGPVSASVGDVESCRSREELRVARPDASDGADALPSSFRTNGENTVVVKLNARPELFRPGMFLDFQVDTSVDQGCLRLPLTAAAGETLWRADRRPWLVSLGFHIDHPFGPLQRTGARVALEMRVIRPIGPVGPFFGFAVGTAGCRGDCPELRLDHEPSGLFSRLGGQMGIEARFAIGSLGFATALGGSLSWLHLGAPGAFPGDRDVGLGGPFATLTAFGRATDPIPGFSPAVRPYTHGPELFVHRLTAFGSGPRESAWVAGLGWRIVAAY